MVPVGSDLTAPQLVDALSWKLKESAKIETDSGSEQYKTSELCEMEEKLVTALTTIRTRRNARSPINRLVPETLAIIFAMLQQEAPDYRPVLSSVSLNRWMTIGHVCRFWRETLHAFPTLWQVLDMRKARREAAYLFLERLRGAPIKIYYEAKELETFDALEAVAGHCDSIQEFHLLSYWSIPESTWNSLVSPAPLLESLTVSVSHVGGTGTVLPALFADQTPNLRKLALHYFTTWPGNHFAGLTHLTLHSQSNNNRQTLAQFLDFLQESPRLEELALVSGGPDTDDITSPAQTHDPVTLDYLRLIEIGAWPSAEIVAKFLSHLILPNTLDMRVWGDDSFQNSDLTALFPPQSQQLERLRCVKRIRITEEPRFCDHQSILVQDSTLDIHGEFPAIRYLGISQICSLDGLEELWLASPMGFVEPTTQEYRDMFRSMTSLTTLLVCKDGLHRIFLALGVFESVQSGSTCIYCPKLETLHVYGGGPGCSSLPVCLFAERRAKAGFPIRHLRAEYFGEEDAAYLRDHIEDVKIVQGGYYRNKMLQPIWPPSSTAFGWPYVPMYWD